MAFNLSAEPGGLEESKIQNHKQYYKHSINTLVYPLTLNQSIVTLCIYTNLGYLKEKTFQNRMTYTFFCNVVWRCLLGRSSTGNWRQILFAFEYLFFVICECNIKEILNIFLKGGSSILLYKKIGLLLHSKFC